MSLRTYIIVLQEWLGKTAFTKTIRAKDVVGWKKKRMCLFAKHTPVRDKELLLLRNLLSR